MRNAELPESSGLSEMIGRFCQACYILGVSYLLHGQTMLHTGCCPLHNMHDGAYFGSVSFRGLLGVMPPCVVYPFLLGFALRFANVATARLVVRHVG